MANNIKLGISDPQDGRIRCFDAENFGEAVVFQGHVALRETVEITVNDAPGQCWGEYIHAEAGSYDCIECKTLERDQSWCIDDAGARVELITIRELFPLHLDYSCYTGCAPLRHKEKPKKGKFEYIANFRCAPAKDDTEKLEFYCFENRREIILIPGWYGGRKVKRADLSGCKLDNCRTLIVDPNVEELIVDFYDAPLISRLEIGSSTRIVGGPAHVSRTPWFSAQPKGPVYIAGWYCGSVGGADLGQSVLEIKDGCIGIAPGADRSSYWKKIIFPRSVKSIGSFAFADMPCLESIEFSEGLEHVGNTVFWNCPRIARLWLPDSLEKPEDFSFDLLSGLKSASMCRKSYSDSEYFLARCDEITIRDLAADEKMNIMPRIWPAQPITGQLTAYAKGRTMYVSGRSYRSPSMLTVSRLGPKGELCTEFEDAYGNKVIFFDFLDRQLFTGSKNLYYNEKRWYIKDENGVTEITRTKRDKVFLVHEGISLEEIQPPYRQYVEKFFPREGQPGE